MQKKKLIIAATASIFSLGVAVFAVAQTYDEQYAKGYADNQNYTITLNSTSGVQSKEGGLFHQIDVRNNKFDMIGWSDQGGNFGSIKKAAHGVDNFVYNGMIYNRSAINGFESLKVTFTGGSLRYVFTDFLMENMDFNGATLTSGTAVEVPAGKAYFIVYNESETPTNIDSLEITYACDGTIDSQMLFNKDTTLGYARSGSKTVTKEDSYITLENNPTKYNNNYSQGKHEGHANNDTWYRWNGRYFTASEELGTEFTFGMTIIGEYSSMTDATQRFHYNVWPQFSYGNSDDEPWAQTYIGNDNYEPLGGANRLHPSDDYAKNAFEGRFFTEYDYINNKWQFADPDTTKIPDTHVDLTMREAYERYNLPFWFIKFDAYLTTVGEDENIPVADIYINNMLITEQLELFENYDNVNTPSIHIKTLPMHLVNYGVDAEGNPDNSYTGSFTYPRLIK